MGFIKAATYAISGTLADQWKDYYSIPKGVPQTAGVFLAVPYGENAKRNANTKGSKSVISDGSIIQVPEGFSLITLENGKITSLVTQPGAYEWRSNDINSKSIFAGDDFVDSLLSQSWERFKFAGTPFASQIALYINQKEIPNNRFGTQNTIYWDDPFFNTQIGAMARGTYTVQIVDPVLFVRNFLPIDSYVLSGAAFDFGDILSPINEQLFNEVVGSLSASLSKYANSPSHNGRIMDIQGDALGFMSALSIVVEDNFGWLRDRGLKITKASLVSLDYDADSKALLSKVRQADALLGARGNSNLQASFAEGLASAGANADGGALGLAMMGMSMNAGGGAVGAMQQPTAVQPETQTSSARNSSQEDPYEHLTKLKALFDQGIITQEEFDAAKRKTLGI